MTKTSLIGEPLALDLINTQVRGPDGHESDLLGTQKALHQWLVLEKDRLTPLADEVDLEALHALRGHIAQAVEQARHAAAPPDVALQALAKAQGAAPVRLELGWDGNRVTSRPRRSGDSTRDLLAELAEAAAELLIAPSIRKVRLCEGPECVMLFLPTHPHRRWCSPALCGNRVRVARYYQRHKT